MRRESELPCGDEAIAVLQGYVRHDLSDIFILTRLSVFEDEASSWEEKLNRIHVLFGAWPIVIAV